MKKILLVEDDADLFSLIQYNLEKEGFQFVGSQTGKGAVELCRREKPDLVILDVRLKGDISGFKILAKIRTTLDPVDMKTFAGKVPCYRVFVQFYCCAMKDRNNDQSGWMEPQGPLADTKVRRALAKAVNLNELNKSFFAGKGSIMYNNPLDPSRRGWKEEWKTKFQDEYGFDPEAAKKLLAEAGFGPGNPMKTTMVLSTATGLSASDDIAESVAAYWRNIGVEVTLDQSDAAIQATKARQLTYDNHSYLVPSSVRQFYGYGIYQSGTTSYRRRNEQPTDLAMLLARVVLPTAPTRCSLGPSWNPPRACSIGPCSRRAGASTPRSPPRSSGWATASTSCPSATPGAASRRGRPSAGTMGSA